MAFNTTQSDFDLVAPDKDVIATQIITKSKKGRTPKPKTDDLAGAITAISYAPTRAGAPALTITLVDPTWHIFDSGIFDADKDGKLDPLEMNYPDGSRYWWRLHQVTPGGANHTIQTTWVPRIVKKMMNRYGPKKTDRAKSTRAEFLKGLVESCDGHFYSRQLDVKQPIYAVSVASTSAKSSSNATAHKTQGIGANTRGITVKGQPINGLQQSVANRLLAVAQKHNAPTVVAEALIFDAIYESDLGVDMSSNGAYGGVLGGSVSIFSPSASSIEAEATAALVGGQGYRSMLQLGRQSSDPAWIGSQSTAAVPFDGRGYSTQYESQQVPGGIAGTVNEAKAIVNAGGFIGGTGAGGGGGGGGTVETIQPYYFTVGSSQNPHESYWDAAQRLSQEVLWDFIVDGDRVYYDSEMTLIKTKPVLQVHREDVEVVDWGFDWEDRNIATNMQLTLMIAMFDVHPGDVVHVLGMGAASTGSTAKLPGRWLIDSFSRDKSALTTPLTLVQPSKPKNEPAPQVTTSSSGGGGVGTGAGNIPGATLASIRSLPLKSVARAIAAAQALSNAHIPYSQAHRQLTVPPQAGGYDCSASTSWVLWQAGMYNGPTSWAWVSGDFEHWGDPGPGKEMTVWCNSGHVFIEFHTNGVHTQINTSPGPGPRYIPWGSNGAADAASGAFVARHFPGL